MPRHAAGKRLWPGIEQTLFKREPPRRYRLVAFAGAALAFVVAIAGFWSVRSGSAPVIAVCGPCYEKPDVGPLDVYGESGPRGLPELMAHR